ncbi:hypothetical protein BCEN4_1590005 [Burkholderia cenocepacia]|nr:hypothetical protein BCEN4_1590005 [Burkholderia cenocepacia]
MILRHESNVDSVGSLAGRASGPNTAPEPVIETGRKSLYQTSRDSSVSNSVLDRLNPSP